jgi:hypothetical protein
MEHVMDQKTACLAVLTVVHVGHQAVAMVSVMVMKTARLVQQIVALVIHIHLGVAMGHVMDQKIVQIVIKIVDIVP